MDAPDDTLGGVFFLGAVGASESQSECESKDVGIFSAILFFWGRPLTEGVSTSARFS
jgi:hypothetical protein